MTVAPFVYWAAGNIPLLNSDDRPTRQILVLGAVFEDAGELHIVEVAFLINGRLSVHLVHLLVCEAVTHGGEQLPKVVLMDETWGGGVEGAQGQGLETHLTPPARGTPQDSQTL